MELGTERLLSGFNKQEAFKSDTKLDTVEDRNAYIEQLTKQNEAISSKVLLSYLGTEQEKAKVNEAIEKAIENEDIVVIDEVTTKKKSWFSKKSKKNAEIMRKRMAAKKACDESIWEEVNTLLQDEGNGLKFKSSTAEQYYLSSIIEKNPKIYSANKEAIDKITKEFGELCTVNDNLRDTVRAIEYLQNNDMRLLDDMDDDFELRLASMKGLKEKTEKEIALVNGKMIETVQYIDYLFNGRPLSINALKRYQFEGLPIPTMDEIKSKVSKSEDDIKARDEEKKQIFSLLIKKYKGDNFKIASRVEFAKNYVLMDSSGTHEAQEHNRKVVEALLALKRAELEDSDETSVLTSTNKYVGRMGLIEGYTDYCNRIAKIDINYLLSLDETILPGFTSSLERLVKETALWKEYDKKYDLSSAVKVTIDEETQIFESKDRKNLRQTKLGLIELLYEKSNLMNYINADNCGVVFESADIKKKYKRVHEINELISELAPIHSSELDKLASQIHYSRYEADYVYSIVEGQSEGLSWIDDVFVTNGGRSLTERRMYSRLSKKNYALAGQDENVAMPLSEQFMRSQYLMADIYGMKELPKQMLQDMMLDIGAGYGLEKRTEENAALVDRARERNRKGVKQFINILGGHLNYLERKYGYIPPAAELMTDIKLKREFDNDFSFSQIAGYLMTFARQIENGEQIIDFDMDNPYEARLYHQIMYYTMAFKPYLGYKASLSINAMGVGVGDGGICEQYIKRLKALQELPQILDSLNYLTNHSMQDIEIKPDNENEKKAEEGIAKLAGLHKDFAKLSEVEQRDIESATRNLGDEQAVAYINKYIEDGVTLSQCKDFAGISRQLAKEEERKSHAFGEDKIRATEDRYITDFVSFDLRTGRATNEETGESHEVTYLSPDTFVLNDIYYKEENVDVNRLYAAFLNSDWVEKEAKRNKDNTLVAGADGNMLFVSANEKEAKKRKTDFCDFMRELTNGRTASKFANLSTDKELKMDICTTHFSAAEILHLIENCNKETVMEFLQPLFEFDLRKMLVKNHFIDDAGNILMDTYTRTLAAPKLLFEMAKMTKYKQLAEKFILHRDFWQEDALAQKKFNKAVFNIDLSNTLKGILTHTNTEMNFEEFVFRINEEYGRNVVLYDHFDEINAIGNVVLGNQVEKVVNGKRASVYESKMDESIPVFDSKSAAKPEVIKQTIAELEKVTFLDGNRKRLIGLEGYEELLAHGQEDLLFFAKKAAYADFFIRDIYSSFTDMVQPLDERNKKLEKAGLNDGLLNKLKDNADKYKVIYEALSIIFKSDIKSYKMVRAKLISGDTDPTWYYSIIKNEYEKLLEI